jgi:AcrR family transcriptional regulator
MRHAAQARAHEEPTVRRDQIIAETIRLIGQRGYYGITVQEVAKQCGLSNAGLLYHVPSKDDLLFAVIQEFERRETEIIAPIAELATRRIGRNEKSTAAARELVCTIVERGSAAPELVRLYSILQAEAFDASHPAHKAFRARETKILNLLTEVVRPYVARPRSTARQVFALMDGLGQQWIRSGQSFDLVAEFTLALEAVLPELAAPARRAKATRKRS